MTINTKIRSKNKCGYSKEQTENMILFISFHLTHFKDFITGFLTKNDERLHSYGFFDYKKCLEEMEEGKNLLRLVKKYKKGDKG